MVSINLLTSEEEYLEDIQPKISNEFIIVHSFTSIDGEIYCNVLTTEEEYMYLRLKYGSENVWLR